MGANRSTYWLLVALPLVLMICGCDNRILTQGRLRYNVDEVFADNPKTLELACAARQGRTKRIDELVRQGANVNSVGKEEITPLWWAAFAENYDGFLALLEKRANPNQQRSNGLPVMHLVANCKDPRFLEAALKYGGDPNLIDRRTGETPVFPAALGGFQRHIDLLLSAGANLNAQKATTGETPSMVAIGARADYHLVYRFFDAGADPTIKTRSGITLADIIKVRSINSSNNSDPWRKKVIDYMRSKGMNVN
jgi:ankyrin repeat protein